MRFALALLVVASLACTDLAILPGGALIDCGDDDDCPADFVCRDNLGQCVPASDLNKPAIDFATPAALSRTKLSHIAGFSTTVLAATFTEAPARPAIVRVDGAAVTCTGEVELSCEIDASALEAGLHSVTVRAIDRAGNEALAELLLEVDLSPPAILTDPSVRLEALAGNLIAQPTALGASVLARVDFAVNELLSEVPAVELAGTPALPLVLDGEVDLTATIAFPFLLQLAAPDPEQGPRRIDLRLVDAVGNEAVIETGALIVVDTEAPSAPDTGLAGALVLDRAPWGAADTPQNAPLFSVQGQPAAVEPGAFVVARFGPAAGDLVLGQAFADPGGAVDLPLIPLDAARVFLTAVDGAGNASPAAVTRDVRWRASLGGKVRGSVIENPHALYEVEVFEPRALARNVAEEARQVATTLGAFAAPLEVESVARFTELRISASDAPKLGGAGAAFHAGRGTVMTFGGLLQNFAGLTDKTFELVDENWREVFTTHRPPPGRAQLVYDWHRDRLVAWISVDNSTWIFDGIDWVELIVDPPTHMPDAVMAYDRVRDRVVLTHAETWIFDGETWTQHPDPGPGARRGAGFTFDPTAGDLLLYGGQTGAPQRDLWRFNDAGWTQLADATDSAAFHAMTEDPATGRVFVVGGTPCVGLCVGDSDAARVFDGADFTIVANSGQPLADLQAVYDPTRARLVWLGGASFQNPFTVYVDAFYILEDTVFRDALPTPAEIGARRDARTVFHPATGEVLFMGGIQASTDFLVFLEDTVGFDTAARPLQDLPEELRFAPFVAGGAAAFIGRFTDTLFTLDAGGTWSGQPLSAPVPLGAAAATHEAIGAGFGFGGQGPSADTFRLDGANVTPLTPTTSPPARSDAVMVYDDRRELMILFGGTDASLANLTDTWAFDGTDWTQLDAAGPDIDGPQLDFDTVRGRALLFAAEGGDPELFELTDTGWNPRAIDLPSGARNGMSAVFHPPSGRFIAHGGDIATLGSQGDTYAWDGGAADRPALIFEVDLRARDAAPGSVISALQVRTTTGGRGHTQRELSGQTPSADAGPGVQLFGWGELWEPLSSAPTDLAAPAALDFDTTDAALITRLARERARLALTPLVGQGPGGPDGQGARLSVERFELVVEYREP